MTFPRPFRWFFYSQVCNFETWFTLAGLSFTWATCTIALVSGDWMIKEDIRKLMCLIVTALRTNLIASSHTIHQWNSHQAALLHASCHVPFWFVNLFICCIIYLYIYLFFAWVVRIVRIYRYSTELNYSSCAR